MPDSNKKMRSHRGDVERRNAAGEEYAPARFPIVGIGASAGGLDAFTTVLGHTSPTTGMAFVIIQHLAPQQPSMLVQLLAKATTMGVSEVSDGMRISPNHVYVIPPNARMAVANGVLSIQPRPPERHLPLPIDHFFRSLAIDQNTLAIGVILSGNESDGTLGLAEIRAEGGLTIVQTESSAKNPAMPRAAIASGVVDLILTPENIGRELTRIAKRLKQPSDEDGQAAWQRLFAALKRRYGVDFADFKTGTISRRVHRRMLLQRQRDLSQYALYVEQNPVECSSLFDDLLIRVTGFMRDPEVFESFEEKVAPRLLSERGNGAPVRIWVPGCSTGEEVYSIGIILLDVAARLSVPITLNLFGTDLNEKAITSARIASYTSAQLEHLSPERRERYFRRVNGGYQVVKDLRDMCIFARHNLGVDPPFSRMDLLSCRNVLIYLIEKLQARVLANFHYALRKGGFLVLGQSETLGDSAALFTALDSRTRVYQKTTDAASPVSFPNHGETPRRIASARLLEPSGRVLTLSGRLAEQIAASEYGPAWVLVDENYRLIESSGDTSSFLRVQPGPASLDILQLARDEVRPELRRVLGEATDPGHRVRTAPIRLNGPAEPLQIDVHRIAEPDGSRHSFLIVFLSVVAGSPAAENFPPSHDDLSAENTKLRKELQFSTERLQRLINERDAAIHELTCANEEVRSSNEELQSINEEVQTSKEEIEAANEELNTLNEELASRNEQLSRLSDDLSNVLLSTGIPILIVDNRLTVQRTTPAAEILLNMSPGDLGRPINEICGRITTQDVQPLVRSVIDSLSAKEVELQNREGHWQALRIRPYRTSDNRIEGAVLAWVDIDQLRQLQLKTEHARKFAESVIESVRTPLAVVDGRFRVKVANRAFLASFGSKSTNLLGLELFAPPRRNWDSPELRGSLQNVVKSGRALDDFEIRHETRSLGVRILSLSARAVEPDGDGQGILVAIDDITDRVRSERTLISEREQLQQEVTKGAEKLKSTAQGLQNETRNRQRTEAALRESETALLSNREELRGLTARLLHAQDEERRRVSRELHDDLSQKMAKLQFDVERLLAGTNLESGVVNRRLESLREQAGALAEDVRRIAHQLHPSTLDHLGLAIALRSYCRDFSSREGVHVRFTAIDAPGKISSAVASSLYRIVQEALRNAAKHAGKDVAVAVTLVGSKGQVRLRIRDNGVGFVPAAVRGRGGLGLVSMEERVRLLNGYLRIKTRPHNGVTIEIAVPLDERVTGR